MFVPYAVILSLLFISSNGVSSQNVTCQQDWTFYGNNCYRFIQSRMNAWLNAQNDCRNYDSNLVTIDNEEENAWLSRFTRSPSTAFPWIGANDRVTEGEWRWVADNSEVTYFHWRPNEPSRPNETSLAREDCVQISYSEWNDFPCYGLLPFVCEKEDVWEKFRRMSWRFSRSFNVSHPILHCVVRTISGKTVEEEWGPGYLSL